MLSSIFSRCISWVFSITISINNLFLVKEQTNRNLSDFPSFQNPDTRKRPQIGHLSDKSRLSKLEVFDTTCFTPPKKISTNCSLLKRVFLKPHHLLPSVIESKRSLSMQLHCRVHGNFCLCCIQLETLFEISTFPHVANDFLIFAKKFRKKFFPSPTFSVIVQ